MFAFLFVAVSECLRGRSLVYPARGVKQHGHHLQVANLDRALELHAKGVNGTHRIVMEMDGTSTLARLCSAVLLHHVQTPLG